MGARGDGRMCAFPGRGERRYLGISLGGRPATFEVPAGVPLRLWGWDIEVDPEDVVAPATVVVRPDGLVSVSVDFDLVGPPPPVVVPEWCHQPDGVP